MERKKPDLAGERKAHLAEHVRNRSGHNNLEDISFLLSRAAKDITSFQSQTLREHHARHGKNVEKEQQKPQSAKLLSLFSSLASATSQLRPAMPQVRPATPQLCSSYVPATVKSLIDVGPLINVVPRFWGPVIIDGPNQACRECP